ncbi:MAG: phage portal protein [Proteobacteria bacterium]|nr:MAG: phage portal protein [Pseudomonadota bacterium]
MRLFGINIGRKELPTTLEKKGVTFIRADGVTDKIAGVESVSAPWENGAMLAAIQWVTKTLGEAPIVVEKLNEDGAWEVQPNHPAAQLIENPNPFYDRNLMLSGIALSRMCSGSAYVLKAKNGNGKTVELFYASHLDINPVSLPETREFIDFFSYRPKGKESQKYEVDEVLYFRGLLNPSNPIEALDPSKSIRRELLTDKAASIYSHRVIERNGTTTAISSKNADTEFDQDDADRLKRLIASATQGEGRGEPIVISDPVEVHQIGSNPEELALKEITSAAEQRICAVNGISPMILGLAAGNDSKTYSNFGEARESYSESYLLPLQAEICGVLNRNLLPEFSNPGETLRFKFDNSNVRILQEDEDSLHTRYREDFKLDLIDRAEFRSKCGLPVKPEDEGVYFSMTLGAIGAGTAPAPKDEVEPEPSEKAKETAAKRLKRRLAVNNQEAA